MSKHRNISRRTGLSLVSIAVASLTTVGALSGCQFFSGVPDTVKIGVAQPLSGGLAPLGQDLVNGVQLAVDELNKKGFKVKGKTVKLEVMVVDDKANPEEGAKVAKQLVDAGVVAVVGHFNSGVSIAVAPIYAEKGIPQLSISSNPKFTDLGLPTTLRFVANDDLQARAIGSYATASLSTLSKAAIVDDGTTYGKGLAQGMIKNLEGKKTVAFSQSFDNKTTDFTALAERLKAEGVQILFSTLSDFQVIALIDALKKIEYNKSLTLFGTNTLKTKKMLEHANDFAGLFCTSGILEPGEFTGGAVYLQAYQTAFKIAPTFGGHYAYDATYAIASAIGTAASTDPKKITQALRAGDIKVPVTGSFKWDAKGEQSYAAISVYGVRDKSGAANVLNNSWTYLANSNKW